MLTRRKLLWGAAGAFALGAGGYKLVRGLNDDPTEDFVRTLPEGLRRSALDCHVHVVGTGAGGTGCWLNDRLRRSLVGRAGFWSLGLSPGREDLDLAYIAYLLGRLRGSGFLKQAVLLAMDATFTSRGERDLAETPFYTPNEYVAGLRDQHAEFLFGASVHPYRPDALDELERVQARGAVLVKWIPNVQAIDVRDARCRVFYRRLAAHKITLLVHTGDEQAVFVAGQEYGDPRRLTAPLEEGVTVIAAHAAAQGTRDGRSNFDLLAEMFPRWPNLFADTSALTLVTNWKMLRRVAERVDLHPRLVHGSDFPLPPAATMFLGSIPLGRWWSAWKRENPFRRDFEIKQAYGLPAGIYTRGYHVLGERLVRLGSQKS